MAIFALLFVGSLFYAYFFYTQVKRPDTDLHAVVPTNAALIIQIKDPIENIGNVLSNNIIWQELLNDSLGLETQKSFTILDSIAKQDPEILGLLKSNTLLSCLLREGATKTGFLHAFKIPKTYTEEDVFEKLPQVFSDSVLLEKDVFNEVTIYGNSKARSTYYFAIFHDFVMISTSEYLVERGIAQLQSETSLSTDPSFQRVYQTAGLNKAANIYIQLDKLLEIASLHTSKEYQESLAAIKRVGNWSEVDVLIRPNSILLNGFTHSYDSLPNYLNLFHQQVPQSFEMAEVLPSSVALVEHYGLSSFSDFYESYSKEYHEKTTFSKKRATYFSNLNETYAFDIEGLMTKWIENEFGYAVKETSAQTTLSDIKDNAIFVLKAKDIHLAKQNLTTIRKRMSNDTLPDDKGEEYREYTIQRLPGLEPLFGQLLGKPYDIFTQNYYTTIGSFVVFTNSRATLRDVINSFLTGKTLSKDLYFNEFSDHTSSESNYMMYCNIARSAHLLQHFGNKNTKAFIGKHLPLFRKFQAVSLQVSKEGRDMYYNNIYLKHNPVYKKETSSLWELILDTHALSKPHRFLNHYTNAEEIVIQDVSHKLYLVSNSGNVQWKKQLSSPILGKVHIVDRYKNDKYQLVFNTKDSLYMVDRKGRDVEDYPIALPFMASAPLSIFDYDNDKDYRLFLPENDGNILCLDIEGKPVEGWAYESSGEIILRPIEHLSINGKDYLMSITDSGRVIALSRRGDERLNLEPRMHIGINSPLKFEKGKSLTKSYIFSSDTSGNVLKLSLSGNLETTVYKLIDGAHYFNCGDVDDDGATDYLLADSNSLYVFDQNKIELFTTTFDEVISYTPQLFYNDDNEAVITVTTSDNSEVYLLDGSGQILEHFPVFGSGSPYIRDVNDDGLLELIVGGTDRTLYSYTVE